MPEPREPIPVSAEQGAVERLRVVTERARALPQVGPVEAAVGLTISEADLWLALDEAAQEIEGQPLNHVRHSSLRRLSKALAALHSQASDEGKP